MEKEKTFYLVRSEKEGLFKKTFYLHKLSIKGESPSSAWYRLKEGDIIATDGILYHEGNILEK